MSGSAAGSWKEGMSETIKNNGTFSLNLLDGASAQAPIIAPELEMQKRAAADPQQPLETRLEAYEDIVESEVGDTSLTRSRNLERDVGFAADLSEIRRWQSHRCSEGSHCLCPGHGRPEAWI